MTEAISILKLADSSWGKGQLSDFYMEITPGNHAYARVKLVVEAIDKLRSKLNGNLLNTEIKVVGKTNHTASEQVLIAGILTKAEMKVENSYAELELSIASGTKLLAGQAKKRSFQDVKLTYKNIIEKVLADTKEAKAIFAAGDYEQKITRPVIQYGENDWEFIKRLASRSKGWLVPDITSAKPKFYFGVKPEKSLKLENMDYVQYNKGKQYSVEFSTLIDYKLGDKVSFGSKSLYIIKKTARYQAGELIYCYKAGLDTAMQPKRYNNQLFAGLALIGRVLESKQEGLKLHLLIDKEQKAGEAFEYIWQPLAGSHFYLMPEKNSQVLLQFRDTDEQHAAVVGCARTNGGKDTKCKELKEYSKRVLATCHKVKKQVKLQPEEIALISDAEAKNSLVIKDSTGLSLQTKLKLKLKASQNIEVKGSRIEIKGSRQINLKRGSSEINLNKRVDIISSLPVKLSGMI